MLPDEDIECEDTEENLYAIESFNKHIRFDDKLKRYVTKPLFRKDLPKIRNNYILAYKRLQSLWRSLAKSDVKNRLYQETMDTMLNNNEAIPAKISPEELQNSETETHFLPHHPVWNFGKLTSACRIVFDSSAKNFDHISLNDMMIVWPKITKDISSLLIKFRTHSIALCGDIRRMYWGFGIDEESQKFFRFLWNKTPTTKPKVYQITRILTGGRDSAFVSQSIIQYHCINTANSYPELAPGCEEMQENVYVDDYLSSFLNTSKAIEIRNQISLILRKARLHISKWTSNSPEVLETIPEVDRAPCNEVFFKSDDTQEPTSSLISQDTKALGITWNCKEDVFSFKRYEAMKPTITYSKRFISSIVPKWWDPTGMTLPFIFEGHSLLSQTWLSKSSNEQHIGWDDPLPKDLCCKLDQWIQRIPLVAQMLIPRHIFANILLPPGKAIFEVTELITFADGGGSGYGACIYVRFPTPQGYDSNLIQAKSKTATSKANRKLSIPRQELNAIILSMTMVLKAAKTLHVDKDAIMINSDSTVCLSWLSTLPTKLKKYVSNRVVKFQESGLKIAYVPTIKNSTDILSKIHHPNHYVNHPFWLKEPSYLQKYNQYPFQPQLVLSEEEKSAANEEMKKENDLKINFTFSLEESRV